MSLLLSCSALSVVVLLYGGAWDLMIPSVEVDNSESVDNEMGLARSPIHPPQRKTFEGCTAQIIDHPANKRNHHLRPSISSWSFNRTSCLCLPTQRYVVKTSSRADLSYLIFLIDRVLAVASCAGNTSVVEDRVCLF